MGEDYKRGQERINLKMVELQYFDPEFQNHYLSPPGRLTRGWLTQKLYPVDSQISEVMPVMGYGLQEIWVKRESMRVSR